LNKKKKGTVLQLAEKNMFLEGTDYLAAASIRRASIRPQRTFARSEHSPQRALGPEGYGF
jgi:hypothetical protein